MYHITVDVQDHEKAQQLSSMLRALDFVMQVSTDERLVSPPSHETTTDRTEEFFSYAGLWTDREISVTTLRQRAWPRQSV